MNNKIKLFDGFMIIFISMVNGFIPSQIIESELIDMNQLSSSEKTVLYIGLLIFSTFLTIIVIKYIYPSLIKLR
jgi:uncharacterized membrane protein